MDKELRKHGWYLSSEGIQICSEEMSNPTVHDIICAALQLDLRVIGDYGLPKDINGGHVDAVHGPIVLQVQKLRNISAPTINEESSGAPRMLKFNVTDGKTHCVALEVESVSCLSMSCIPGTKLCLIGKNIAVRHGMILLKDGCVKALGGEVEKLKSNWEVSKNLGRINERSVVANGSQGPPPFIEFNCVRAERRVQSTDGNKGKETALASKGGAAEVTWNSEKEEKQEKPHANQSQRRGNSLKSLGTSSKSVKKETAVSEEAKGRSKSGASSTTERNRHANTDNCENAEYQGRPGYDDKGSAKPRYEGKANDKHSRPSTRDQARNGPERESGYEVDTDEKQENYSRRPVDKKPGGKVSSASNKNAKSEYDAPNRQGSPEKRDSLSKPVKFDMASNRWYSENGSPCENKNFSDDLEKKIEHEAKATENARHDKSLIKDRDLDSDQDLARQERLGHGRSKDRPREDRPREDRPREDRPREDRSGEDGPQKDGPQKDRAREDRAREDRSHDDRAREDRPREDRAQKDRPREDRPREDRSRDYRSREDRSRDDRPQKDRAREDRAREDRSRNDRAQKDRAREDRSRDDRAQEDRPQKDRLREDRPREDRAREDRSREDRPREDSLRDYRPQKDRPQKDRAREDSAREDRSRDDRPREDRAQEDRPREDLSRDDRAQEDRPRKDRVREDRAREDPSREDRAREDRAREDCPREDRPREDRSRKDRPQKDRPREDGPQKDRAREDRSRDDRSREDRPREDRSREDRPQNIRPREDFQKCRNDLSSGSKQTDSQQRSSSKGDKREADPHRLLEGDRNSHMDLRQGFDKLSTVRECGDREKQVVKKSEYVQRNQEEYNRREGFFDSRGDRFESASNYGQQSIPGRAKTRSPDTDTDKAVRAGSSDKSVQDTSKFRKENLEGRESTFAINKEVNKMKPLCGPSEGISGALSYPLKPAGVVPVFYGRGTDFVSGGYTSQDARVVEAMEQLELYEQQFQSRPDQVLSFPGPEVRFHPGHMRLQPRIHDSPLMPWSFQPGVLPPQFQVVNPMPATAPITTTHSVPPVPVTLAYPNTYLYQNTTGGVVHHDVYQPSLRYEPRAR